MAERKSWKIDPAHSSVEFSVKHLMFTTVRGRFKNFNGTIQIDEENPDHTRAEVEIDASSLDTGAEDRDRHLRSADFLDVENHPTIRFRSTRVEGAAQEEGKRFRLHGELTIRGESIPVELDAQFEGEGKDPWGNERAGFSAKAELDRRDWGLRWNQALETGGVLVGNTVKVDLDVQAVKEESGAARQSA